jgi:hypothetical protein
VEYGDRIGDRRKREGDAAACMQEARATPHYLIT